MQRARQPCVLAKLAEPPLAVSGKVVGFGQRRDAFRQAPHGQVADFQENKFPARRVNLPAV